MRRRRWWRGGGGWIDSGASRTLSVLASNLGTAPEPLYSLHVTYRLFVEMMGPIPAGRATDRSDSGGYSQCGRVSARIGHPKHDMPSDGKNIRKKTHCYRDGISG